MPRKMTPTESENDPRLLALRDCAARGLTRAQSATETGISYNTVAWLAKERRITLRRTANGQCAAPRPPKSHGDIPKTPVTMADFARIENAAMRRRQA
jgi:hypothetical protein